MSTMKELLGQGDIPKPRRNFLQENVRRLKDLKLEKTTKTKCQRTEYAQPLTERKNIQTTGGRSQLSAESRLQRKSSPSRHGRAKLAATRLAEPPRHNPEITPKGYRSQGCQTLNLTQLESLYHDGVIRYPSVRRMPEVLDSQCDQGVSVKEMGLQTEDEPQVITLHSAPDTTDLHWEKENEFDSEIRRQKDFVKMNSTIPEPQRHKLPESSCRSDPTRAPPCYQRGVVPKYLREHKKEVERDRVAKALEASNECPEGHILLPEEVRTKHLTTLKEKYAILVSQLNKLPVSTDTLRTRMRKKEIEEDLDRIEAAMALFSREKVFVKADS